MKFQSDKIHDAMEESAEILDRGQRDFIRLRHLHLISVLEMPSILISNKVQAPLPRVDFLIKTLLEIAEYIKRKELEYHVVVSILQSAPQGAARLIRLLNTSPQPPEITQKILRLAEDMIVANSLEWEFCAPDNILRERLFFG